jgi:hypothetical protein
MKFADAKMAGEDGERNKIVHNQTLELPAQFRAGCEVV